MVDLSTELDATSYDEQRFLSAVTEALDAWRRNERYRRRCEAAEVPERIESFDDVRRLPAVDMREFKQHPEDLVVDRERVSEEYALYSSGTTSDSQSYTLRSAEGYERHKRNFQQFARYLMPDLDHMHALSPATGAIEKLPESQARRAVFTYPQWIFSHLETEFYVGVTEGELVPDVDGMVENIQRSDGNQGVFSTPNQLYELAKELSERGVNLDLGADGAVVTAGGWKGEIASGKEAFRELLNEVFGVGPREHLDFYGCTELFFPTGNRFGDGNPDLKRIAPQGYVWIADEDTFLESGRLERVEDGEPGLLVAVDPTNTDYPGVLLTDDVVRKTGGEYGADVRIEYVGRSSMR